MATRELAAIASRDPKQARQAMRTPIDSAIWALGQVRSSRGYLADTGERRPFVSQETGDGSSPELGLTPGGLRTMRHPSASAGLHVGCQEHGGSQARRPRRAVVLRVLLLRASGTATVFQRPQRVDLG